ncbi:MAG: hypothetical protein J0L84_05645 [Verrucomicrobia bacterium]|nr:hypothetical protein [Verrucomicrobiota bacterium]
MNSPHPSTDPWEQPLASWTPRKPSPALRRRIFGRYADLPAPPEVTPVARGLAWLVPALGTAVIIGTMVVGPAHPQAGGFTGHHSAEMAALDAAAAQSFQNTLSSPGFAWTNTAPGPSTNGSLRGLN